MTDYRAKRIANPNTQYDLLFAAKVYKKDTQYSVYLHSTMVRTTKTSDKNVIATPAAAASVAAPVQAAAPKKAASKKTEKAVAPVVAAAPVVSTPVVESAAPVVDAAAVVETSSVAKFNEINATLQKVTGIINTLKTDLKALEKVVAREQKLAQKVSKTSRKASGNRAPSGFVKPTLISDELAIFLGKSVGTEMSRTEVCKELQKYIIANNLQLPTNRRVLKPDGKLTSLLRLAPGDENGLTYFNLQKFMKHHFIKAEVVATA